MIEPVLCALVVALPTGTLLNVPSEYATIEEAAAVAVPGDSIIIEPGVYAPSRSGLLWIPGLQVESSTGSAADVTLAGFTFSTAEKGATLLNLTLTSCDWESANPTNCVFVACGSCLVSTITNCVGELESFWFGSISDSELTGLTSVGQVWSIERSQLTGAGAIDLQDGPLRDSVIDGMSLAVHGANVELAGTTFRNVAGTAVDVGRNSALIAHCTFVGNGTDLVACGGDGASVTLVNSIATSINPIPCDLDLACAAYVLPAEGNVTRDGAIIVASAADGTANHWLGLAAFECPMNIGADQTGAVGRCQVVQGDLNNDGLVNALDLGIMLGAWGQPHQLADFSCPEGVDAADLGVLLGAWTG